MKCTGDATTGETVVVANGTGTWATLDISGAADNAVVRMTAATEANSDLALGETLTITTTDASFKGAEITVYAVKL